LFLVFAYWTLAAMCGSTKCKACRAVWSKYSKEVFLYS